MIVATAGHVDHGKTLLVKALTGVDTDRLPEEKARGLSIELGYAFHDLGDGEQTGFIDVPGHERFVRTMVAGVCGTDVVLFVVAADDGPMPQTAEHLAILDLLGVERGLIVITKCDRVEPARVDEVTALIRAMTTDTTLAACTVVPVSAHSGVGIETLRAALLALKRSVPTRSHRGNFRLAVDRSFVLKGAGRVVTGTVFAGRVGVGDALCVAPGGGELRVRGIHAQNRPAAEAVSGLRCALNLSGAAVRDSDIARGQWIVGANAAFGTQRIDARIRVLAAEAGPLRSRAPVHVHVGAADTTGRVLPLAGTGVAPGEYALVQLQLDQPLHAVHGDRVILRDQSARRTVGGGVVLNPLPEERRTAREVRLRVATAMAHTADADALGALLADSAEGVDLARFAQARNLAPSEAAALFGQTPMATWGTPPALHAVAPARWQVLLDAVTSALAQLHAAEPAREGVGRAAIRAALVAPLPPALLDAVLDAAQTAGLLVLDHGLYRLPDHRAVRDPADERMWQRVRPLLDVPDSRVPVFSDLLTALKMPAPLLEGWLLKFVKQGALVRVSPKRYFLPAMIARQAACVRDLAASAADGRFTAADFRDRSGLGRNAVIEILEHFDATGLTRREGDSRVVLRR